MHALESARGGLLAFEHEMVPLAHGLLRATLGGGNHGAAIAGAEIDHHVVVLEIGELDHAVNVFLRAADKYGKTLLRVSAWCE